MSHQSIRSLVEEDLNHLGHEDKPLAGSADAHSVALGQKEQ
jgi:hypothetical protein